MNTKEALKILKNHNEWRRGKECTPYSPTIIGEAIDIMVDQQSKLDLTVEWLKKSKSIVEEIESFLKSIES